MFITSQFSSASMWQEWEVGSCWFEGMSGFREGGCGVKSLQPLGSGNLGPVDEERNLRAMPWGGSWRCIPVPLPRHFPCSTLVIVSRVEDQTKYIFTGLNYTLVVWQIQEDCGNQLVCLFAF